MTQSNILRLKDKVALITGASRGMGRAGAILFAQNGANIVVNYYSNKDAADAVVNKINGMGRQAIAVQADVGNLNDLPKLVDATLNEFGKIDILYHNAATHYACKTLDDITEEIWDMTHNQILKGPFFLTKLVIPHMLKQGGGNILFTSTSSTEVPFPADPHYMTAKGGINVLYKNIAGWVCPEIRVNCLVPGAVKTDMFRHHPPQVWEGIAKSLPMGRMATPMDVAKAALFLVSSEADYLTGVSLPVDGGRTAAVPRKSPQVAQIFEAVKPGFERYEKEEYGDENIEQMDTGLVDMDTDSKSRSNL